MTDNPLLRSKEERFRRATIGNSEPNPFAIDPPEQLETPTTEPPPVYVTTYDHRGWLLVGLGVAGLIGNMLGMSSIIFLNFALITFTVLALGPALAAWLLSREDLKAIQAGAMNPAGESLTRLAYWLGLASSVLAMVAVLGLTVLFFVIFV